MSDLINFYGSIDCENHTFLNNWNQGLMTYASMYASDPFSVEIVQKHPSSACLRLLGQTRTNSYQL